MSGSADSQDASPRGPAAEPAGPSGMWQLRLTASAVVVLGALVLWQTYAIPQGAAYAAVGPRALPLVVGAGLLVTGTLFLLSATVLPDAYLVARARTEAALTHWPTPTLLGGLLVTYALLMPVLGYIIATSVFVPASARVLGSRALVRDMVTGLVIAVLLYIGFSGYLGIRLPDGLLTPLMELVR